MNEIKINFESQPDRIKIDDEDGAAKRYGRIVSRKTHVGFLALPSLSDDGRLLQYDVYVPTKKAVWWETAPMAYQFKYSHTIVRTLE